MNIYFPSMPAVLNKYITIDPDILNGTPVISGTRIPVERLEYLIRAGYTQENINQEFPHVESRKIRMLISYLVQVGLDAFEASKEKTSSK